MGRRAWFTVGSTLCGFVLVGGVGAPAIATTATLVDESFTAGTTTSANWVLPTASVAATNDACLTPSSDTSQTPIPGCAASGGAQPGLQLTTNAGGQEGGLAYSSSVPSSLGLDVTFTSYQYTGSAADGIAFFLAASDPNNAGASPITLGPPGGSLGYSPYVPGGAAGLTHGYLGVGLDVYGNYTNPGFGGSDCTDGVPALVPQSVTVRGAGNGTTGYCRLNTQTVAGTLDSSTPQAVPVEVAVNPTGTGLTSPSGLFVAAHSYRVRVTPLNAEGLTDETGSLPNASGTVPDPSWLDANGVPNQLSFGWSASTGASVDFHTVSNVHVQTLNGTPPALGVTLTDDSGGTAHTGQIVTYTATASVNDANETRPITLTDTFPGGLTPQSTGLGGPGWSCGVSSPTVTCTHPAANIGALGPVIMPVLVAVPAGPPQSLSDTVTVGSPDATQGSATDTKTYSPAPTATALSIISQPVNSQVNTAMKNADATTTHVRVAANVTAGGAVDTTYTGTVTLAFANNPGSAKFVVAGSPTPTLTAAAVNGVADFSPIVVNAVGFGDTLQATATGLSPATTTPFDVSGAATSCPSGQTCTITTTSPGTGDTALVQAQPGAGNAIITATYGGNVAPIHPCTGTSPGILTFSGDRPKLITLTLTLKKLPIVLFCYGQPTPFIDLFLRTTTFFNPVNQDYEGLLPPCLPKLTGPCIKSLTLTKTTEKVVIFSGAADPHLSH